MTVTDAAAVVHPTNRDQASSWNGEEGAYWAEHADRFDRAVADHHRHLMTAAAIERHERVLDLGCGTGRTTRDAALAADAGGALGVDLSAPMIEVARRRAHALGIANATFVRADAQVHPFAPEQFDVAISRTGTMFFGDPVAAFTNVARALRPGGRVALLVWRRAEDNEWIRELLAALALGRPAPVPPPDAPGPFAMADPARTRSTLEAAGFTDVVLDAAESPMWFGTDAQDAAVFVGGLLGWMLRDLDGRERDRALDSLRASTAAHETSHGVVYGSATWIVRARRGRPA